MPQTIGVNCPLVNIGTDPVVQELRVANGDTDLLERLAVHRAHFTFGENIGRPDCPVPPLPFPCRPMRQPVLLDYWKSESPARRDYTTITNWETTHFDYEYKGQKYSWSKHQEYMKIIDLPQRTSSKLELAIGRVKPEVQCFLRSKGWSVIDALPISLDPWPYRDYIRNSGAEFTVAKDMNVSLCSGWFSERSACYLAAGKPVVTQDTGFSRVLPIGEGLFAFRDIDDILTAMHAINSNYERHSRAARAIAEEYFRAEAVLTKVLDQLGL